MPTRLPASTPRPTASSPLLVAVPGSPGKQIHQAALGPYLALVKAARAQGFAAPLFEVVSGFRDDAKQKALFDAAVQRYGSVAEARKWVAPPGNSAHGTGLAIDFNLGSSNSSANVQALQRTRAWLWLSQVGGFYGFVPYEAEPWHWEYNPAGTGLSKMDASVSASPLEAGLFGKLFSVKGLLISTAVLGVYFYLNPQEAPRWLRDLVG